MNTMNNDKNKDIEYTSIDYSIEDEFAKAVFNDDPEAESHVSEWFEKNTDDTIKNLC